jgi:hypothetical protein
MCGPIAHAAICTSRAVECDGQGNLYAIKKRTVTPRFQYVFRLHAVGSRIRFGAAVKQKWNSCSGGDPRPERALATE